MLCENFKNNYKFTNNYKCFEGRKEGVSRKVAGMKESRRNIARRKVKGRKENER